ncbi:MAG: hypothetical protein ABJN39_10620 [Sulfitobacter sp.]|uniref:hypothetical protein n=1 Tax=Alphaproteobacteria TaxID=28211 RepID=UPI003298F2C5
MRKAMLLVVILLCTSAQADEQWQSNYGDVIYEADFGDIAILSFPGGHPGHRVQMYVEGLGGNYDQRGVFSGYWIAPEQGDCPKEIRGEDGLETNTWGSLEVTFDSAAFPSSFTAQLANCFGEDMEALRAIAQFSDAVVPTVLPAGSYFHTDFGPVEFSCTSTGHCRGVYEEGQSFLYIEPQDETGNFSGIWAEPDANQTCRYAKDLPDIRTAFWGTVEMHFDAEAESWSGSWGYCDMGPASDFQGSRGFARAQPPASLDNDSDTISRLLGSWLPAPGSEARRNDMYTFNPDGTRTVSDGSGMNTIDTWAAKDGQLEIESRPVDLDFANDTLILSGTKMVRTTLWEEKYSGRYVDPSIDSYGVFAPRDAITVGAYSLHLIVFAPTAEFQSHASNPEASVRPILIEFWNEAEPIKRAESGNAYRNDTVRFEPETYEITKDQLKFYGRHPEWGEIFFNGQFEGLESDVPIWGDLMVKGFVFRDVAFASESLH